VFGLPSPSPWDSDALIREELLSAERLDQHAIQLAKEQAVSIAPAPHFSLHKRLSDNERVLLAAYRTIGEAAADDPAITPAAEWLIDNYHLVEEQIQQIHDDLPPRFYRQLPKLAAGALRGYPRVFGVAWACVAHSDSRLDPEMLRRFVAAYQTIQPLMIGELWAVAITLRIVLIENLRRAAVRIIGSRAARQEADRIANQLLGVNGLIVDPDALIRRHRQDPILPPAFVVQLVKRLRDQDPRVTPALQWLDQRLAALGSTSEDMVRDEHQRQGASNVTVRNIITSMRLVSDINWPEVFEKVSLVDDVLRSGSDFAAMDFPTRNLYRSVIEELSRGSSHTELEIARAAVAAAKRGTSPRERDPGHYLVSQGRDAFERALGYRAPLRHWASRLNAWVGPGGYIAMVALLSMSLLAIPVAGLDRVGIHGLRLACLALSGMILAIDVAVAVINRTVTREFGATLLPGLALRAGVPAEFRTLVVVPMLLTTPESLQTQIERLEVHYLASEGGEIQFALLTDWIDADSETTGADGPLYRAASEGITRLNRSHGPAPSGARFYLLHRRRRWCDCEQRWMGWERKRGKLHELNRLLRGANDTTFIDQDGRSPNAPPGIRFVVTVDADTRLPREAVRRLVGKLAHPLNRPLFDEKTGRVTDGYAVLQPRVTPSLPVGREGSLFQRIFSSMAGIDPYDTTVSDVYQDLFGEGSYAGKGIYDIDAFEAALATRVPDGTLLSHDLFEGIFARAGLVSDIEVVEEFPARYDVAAARLHRWARGDWQLLPWILGRGDVARRGSGSLPLLGEWKMIDNLRRTLSAPSSVVALFFAWTLPLHAALLWTGVVILAIGLPAFIPVLAALVPRRRGVQARSHLRALRHDVEIALLQSLLATTFLAHQAWLMSDAIVRTLYRLMISRRHLLEWVTAAQAQLTERLDLKGFYRRMSGSVALAFAAIAVVGWVDRGVLWVAMPFIVLWIAAPAVARRISVSPLVAGRVSVSADDALSLRIVARRTWRYFETFVTSLDNHLPPDNFQEDPQAVLAHRTSPTNIGLYLLCTISARDFGWIGALETIKRLEAILGTLHRLQKFRGHLYNWYDTQDLRALEPHYVSSVDSGNLAAHLIALANACRERRAVTAAAWRAGIEDAIYLTRQALEELPDVRRSHTISQQILEDSLDTLRQTLRESVVADHDLEPRVAAVVGAAQGLADGAKAHAADQSDTDHGDMVFWAEATRDTALSWQRELMQSADIRRALVTRLEVIEKDARSMAYSMQFDFLLDPERKLLSIGYRADDNTLDPSCYDLLASEARLASFFAIAKNDVPTRHWFRLGRAVTPSGSGAALISWSGSMFEYLMPALVMRAPAASLLEQTSRLIVDRQITYGDSLGVPWGISESAYSARDLEFTYQYSNFGVPGLGLKRGLRDNVVIAPYATALAAMVDPAAAVTNFERLADIGVLGRYGFYESLDYTPSRLPKGVDLIIVRAYMAHHQGMSIVAIANVLFDSRMRARFHAESSVRATELLLQERTPRDVSLAPPRAEELGRTARTGEQLPQVRQLQGFQEATPQTHLLSNGRYSVMLTSVGSGSSRWQNLALTRWREDVTRDDTGSYIFLRDVATGRHWSAGFQPAGVEPHTYQATFTEDRAEIIRSDDGVVTTLQVVVSPEDDAEARCVGITNTGSAAREIDITSYSELVLTNPAADTAHPAFSKMFIRTEYIPKSSLLIGTRRQREPQEPEVWVAHHAVVEAETIGEPQFETDRARFLGRGREIQQAIAISDGRRLSNTVGTVLDPIFALRYRVRIAAGATARLTFWTAVASTRSQVVDLYDKHQDKNAFTRAATLAWTQGQVQLRHLGITSEEAILFQQLAGSVLYADASMRPSSDAIGRAGGAPSALWAQGISGDLPLVLLRIDQVEDIGIVRQLLQAHEYWRLKQLAVDLVILNDRASSYVQDLQVALEALVRTSQSRPSLNLNSAHGAVFVLRTDLISAETRNVLSAAARVVLVAQRGSLAEQMERRSYPVSVPQGERAITQRPAAPVLKAEPLKSEFFNGVGGFSDDGREYLIQLNADSPTPLPWINVIANSQFGFQVAAEGGGYTWSVNSRENQLTQWSNDPVSDRPGEVLYVRDEETGALWGPTALPVRDAAPYTVRHGQGYSRFEHTAHDISLDLVSFVPLADPIKICRLSLANLSKRRRRLSVTAYVEWVLGTSRSASAPHVVTELDSDSGAMLARNPWNRVFGSRVAFADLSGRQTHWTADRREFLGRHGTLERPAALADQILLSGRTGAGLDPCCALQVPIELEAGETVEVVFFLGEAESVHEVRSLLRRYRSADWDSELRKVTDYWDGVLGTVQVKTPDRSMNLMLNRWLLYQTLCCRFWARSAFYQASGAFGFRDQLQDSMALVIAQPSLVREHLLRAAGRQFAEGDVQHWWLPPAGQGVRTRISDDRIWLAYAADHYLKATSDLSLLDENIGFIEGAKLREGEHDAFFEPRRSDLSATFFEHCARGLDASLQTGRHGLPLFGTGDWNDGMNRIGEQGRGESVWLGWFLHTTLAAFSIVAQARGDTLRGERWLAHAAALREALDQNAWDGGWYRRGYYDNGGPLGSAANDECRIDSIAQSWAVISGAADLERATTAMAALDSQLIRRSDAIALLFTPPFDRGSQEPGYIKAYPPGLRENGGQYTHAAAWSIIAFAHLGQGGKAVELFSLLNPINHSNTRTGMQRYKGEPYVVAADVYSVAPHVGRAGWTWYTGAAGWLYRSGLESILGFLLQGDHLLLNPCIPTGWPEFELTYKYRTATYVITVINPDGVSSGVAGISVDGESLPAGESRFLLRDDGVIHPVRVTLGRGLCDE
jgi:cyclic beta-1,2-glucan synthetase